MADTRHITVRYFAAFREAMGRAEMQISVPDGIGTVSTLIDWLDVQNPYTAPVFADRARVHIALNNVLASGNTAIHAGDVVDLFPPVSGG